MHYIDYIKLKHLASDSGLIVESSGVRARKRVHGLNQKLFSSVVPCCVCISVESACDDREVVIGFA